MELKEKDYKILELIAEKPELTKKEISEETGISENSVGQRVYKFREHGLVVKNHGSGALKTVDSSPMGTPPENVLTNTSTELYDNEEFEWLITGKGETELKEYREEIKERLSKINESLKNRKVYRPSHVLD